MAQKATINVCLRLIFVASVVVALAQATCIDKIREIQNTQNGRMLMGGYRAIKDPQNNDVVKGILADTVKEYNQRSNDLRHFHVAENGITEAYSQLVNGQNFCLELTLVSAGCKNRLDSEFCTDEKTVTCVVSAYKAFSEKDATINRDTLECRESA